MTWIQTTDLPATTLNGNYVYLKKQTKRILNTEKTKKRLTYKYSYG